MSDFDAGKFLVASWKCGGKEYFTFVIETKDWPENKPTPKVADDIIRYLRPDRKTAMCLQFACQSSVSETMFIMELTKYS